MSLGICSLDELERVVDDYFQFDEFVFDVETFGPYRGDPHRNEIFWIGLAGPGRADVIPCGHPVGERIVFPDDGQHRPKPNSKAIWQERRINPETGREKWFGMDPEDLFLPAPKQLWVSDVCEALRPLFFSTRIRKVNQNIKFDLISIAKYFGAVPPGPYGDTLVAAKLINENQLDYRLGSMVQRTFKFQYEKIGKAVEAYPFSEAYQYSYFDARYTWLLWQHQKPLLEKEGLVDVLDLEMQLLPVLIDMERRGIRIDEEALDAFGEKLLEELARLQLQVDKRAGFSVNLNANAQVAMVVYEILGKPILFRTEKTGAPSTRAEHLERFSKNPTVGAMLEHAKLRKLHGTFVDGLKATIVDGEVHPDFNQTGAVTGRLSARSPNVQQIPSRSEMGKHIRDVFVARPGHVFVVSDLSQIELRMLAHCTQDKKLVGAYRKDLDLHAMTAKAAFGEDFTPVQRSLAKNSNFAALYGAGPDTMVRRYQIPDRETAERLRDSFYRTYRTVIPWKEQTIREATMRMRSRNPPYVTTILGRKRRLPELVHHDLGIRSAAERQAISVVIQGSAADLFKVIMVNCHNMLLAQPWEGHILMTVHDELVVEVPEEHAEDGLRIVREAMENVMNPFTGEPMLSVPLKADAKVVRRWSEAK